ITILVPAASNALITVSISRAAPGSRFAVGSSRNSTSGCSAHARASARRCCSPPESTRAGRCARWRSPTSSSAASASAWRSLAAMFAIFRAYTTLASAERRSITGRWNTIAWRRRTLAASGSFHRTRPALGLSSPCIRRMSTLFPAPFAPRMMVLGSASMVSVTLEIIDCPLLAYETLSSASGRIEARLAIPSLRALLDELRGSVYGEHNRNQHGTEAECERQVALGGLERDGGGHDSRHAVDIAADDHDGAHLGRRASQAGEHRRDEREARVPHEREARLELARAEGAQLLLVFAPRILERLAGERGDNRQYQHGLGDDHRARRKEQSQFAERACTGEEQIDEKAHHHRRQAHQRIQQDNHRAASGKALHGKQRAERQPERRGDEHGAEAHLEA